MAYRGADPTDVMGRRIGAYFIDGLLMLAVMAAVLYPFWISNSETAPSGTVECADDNDDEFDFGEPRRSNEFNVTYGADICFDNGSEVRYVPTEKEGRFVVGVFGTWAAVYGVNLVLIQGAAGGSIGKLILGLRTVRNDGSNAGIGRSLGRTLLLPIDAACCSIVGLLTAFNSQGHRRVGDMVASTMVISREDQDALVLARSGQTLPGRVDIAAQQWTEQNSAPTPPASWDPSGGIALPGEPPRSGPAPEAPGEGPTWDPARNAYIQYDRNRSTWMQFDDKAQQWKEIDT